MIRTSLRPDLIFQTAVKVIKHWFGISGLEHQIYQKEQNFAVLLDHCPQSRAKLQDSNSLRLLNIWYSLKSKLEKTVLYDNKLCTIYMNMDKGAKDEASIHDYQICKTPH